jgi:Sulfotransferase family
MQIRNDPLIIGALGGSGTRVVVRIARHGGVFMGGALNSFEDSLPLNEYYDHWLRRYLERAGDLSPAEEKAAATALRQSLDHHLAGLAAPDAPWGIKVPKTILMLPFWHQLMPGLKFLHVIRSGLDMAFSQDSNQLDAFGDLILTPAEQAYVRPQKAMAYWQRVNQKAAEYGQKYLGQRYLAVRFEDLCANPETWVQKIFTFIEAPDRSRAPAAVMEIEPPSTIGRWRSAPPSTLYQIMLIGRPALEQFRYWADADWRAVERGKDSPIGRLKKGLSSLWKRPAPG